MDGIHQLINVDGLPSEFITQIGNTILEKITT